MTYRFSWTLSYAQNAILLAYTLQKVGTNYFMCVLHTRAILHHLHIKLHMHSNTTHSNKQYIQTVCWVNKSDTLSGGKVCPPVEPTLLLLPVLWYYVTIKHLGPTDVAFMNVLCVVAHIILRDFMSAESFSDCNSECHFCCHCCHLEPPTH